VRREQLEHVIAASAEILETDRFVVIGSQAIHSIHDPPPAMLVSIEVDVYPADAPARADEIDAMLGDGSMFHTTFGYYAHGVGPETARAPADWEERLVPVQIQPRSDFRRSPMVLFLERHDLILAKAVASREHDLAFIQAAIQAHVIGVSDLMRRVPTLPVNAGQQQRIRDMLHGLHRATQGARKSAVHRPGALRRPNAPER